MVFQQPAPFLWLTVEQNIAYGFGASEFDLMRGIVVTGSLPFIA